MSNIEERYTRAVFNSRDLDALIAAGWSSSNGLGPLLWRLRAEFDTVGREAMKEGGNPETGLLLALMALRTLVPAREALGTHSLVMATKRRIMLNDQQVLKQAGAALQYWLHPTCDHCTGRGVTGGYGEPQRICEKCHGSKLRRVRHAGEEEEACFNLISHEIERKLDALNRQMKRLLSQPGMLARLSNGAPI